MRTGVLVGAVAALWLAVTSCSAPAGEVEAPGTPPASGASATPAIDQASVAPCPPWDEPPDYPDGPLPAGAVSLRICAGDDSVLHPPRFWAGIAAPADALTTDVASLVEEVNALPGFALGPDEFCSQEGRPRIKYVFGYPDGSTSTITHGYGACHVLELAEPGDFPAEGDLFRPGAIEFGDTVEAALLDQRESMRPPREVDAAPGCVPNIAPRSVLPARELDLASAALCLLPDGQRYRRVELDPGLMRRIADVLHGDGGELDEDCDALPFGKVVARSTWGDVVQLDISLCAFEVWSEDADGPVYLPLGPDLVADLLALPRGPWVEQR